MVWTSWPNKLQPDGCANFTNPMNNWSSWNIPHSQSQYKSQCRFHQPFDCSSLIHSLPSPAPALPPISILSVLSRLVPPREHRLPPLVISYLLPTCPLQNSPGLSAEPVRSKMPSNLATILPPFRLPWQEKRSPSCFRSAQQGQGSQRRQQSCTSVVILCFSERTISNSGSVTSPNIYCSIRWVKNWLWWPIG